MNLEILSYGEALRYVPKDETYAVRISNSMDWFLPELRSSDFWVDIKEYYFDDVWPASWKEYSNLDFDEPYFSDVFGLSWKKLISKNPLMTKKSFLDWREGAGQLEGRVVVFDKYEAMKILEDYDKFGKNTESVMVHCNRGKNRAPAVGIAMNEIYGWGVGGLKEKFPNYRKFIYQTLLDVS